MEDKKKVGKPKSETRYVTYQEFYGYEWLACKG